CTILVATHFGTACLLALFILLGRGTGSLACDRFTAASGVGLLFALSVVGFGSKAGFMPFHVWLPDARPAAPSHVSAVMSGVMIKTGIYGLVRVLTFLGPLPAWAGWLLIGVGVTSGVLGVLFALAQRDLKRLLAYSSVENIAIIALGLGLGLVGLRVGSTSLAVLGFGGGLLHVFNHAVFKGLLFLGAGSVLHATGTRDLDELGGLLKRIAMQTLAAGCLLIGMLAPIVVQALAPLLAQVTGLPADRVRLELTHAAAPLGWVTLCALGLIALATVLAAVRRSALSRRSVGQATT